MEFLKKHLGEQLYNDLTKALEGTGIKLADLSAGEYVSKGKFEAEVNKVKALDENIKSLTEQVKTFDGVDLDGLKKQATEWEEKYNKDIHQIKFDTSLEKELIKSKVRNIKAVKALIDSEKIELDENGLKGLNEQLEALKQSDAYLFENTEITTGVKIDTPIDSKDDDKGLRSIMGLD